MHTLSLFQRLHADTMNMSPKSNGHGHIAHGRCGMTSWMEGCLLKEEMGRSIGIWLFEDVVCRWSCMHKIITDNVSVYRAAVAWLEEKYGIKGIRISSYNSKANGRIERPHWDKENEISRDFLFNGVPLDSSDHEIEDDAINDEQNLFNHDDFDL